MSSTDYRTTSCKHHWVTYTDWEGDPGIPGGTRRIVSFYCTWCGEQTFTQPAQVHDDQTLEDYFKRGGH